MPVGVGVSEGFKVGVTVEVGKGEIGDRKLKLR